MTLFQIVALYIALNLLLTPVLMYRVGQIRITYPNLTNAVHKYGRE